MDTHTHTHSHTHTRQKLYILATQAIIIVTPHWHSTLSIIAERGAFPVCLKELSIKTAFADD